MSSHLRKEKYQQIYAQLKNFDKNLQNKLFFCAIALIEIFKITEVSFVNADKLNADCETFTVAPHYNEFSKTKKPCYRCFMSSMTFNQLPEELTGLLSFLISQGNSEDSLFVLDDIPPADVPGDLIEQSTKASLSDILFDYTPMGDDAPNKDNYYPDLSAVVEDVPHNVDDVEQVHTPEGSPGCGLRGKLSKMCQQPKKARAIAWVSYNLY